MSVSVYLQPQCSADALHSIDGSGSNMHLSSADTSDVTSPPHNPESRPRSTALPQISETSLLEEGEPSGTQPSFKLSCGDPPNDFDGSSASESGTLDLSSSPRPRSPTSSTSSHNHLQCDSNETKVPSPCHIDSADGPGSSNPSEPRPHLDGGSSQCSSEDQYSTQNQLSPLYHSSSQISPPSGLVVSENGDIGSPWTPSSESGPVDWNMNGYESQSLPASPPVHELGLHGNDIASLASDSQESSIDSSYETTEASSEEQGMNDDSDSTSAGEAEYQDDTDPGNLNGPNTPGVPDMATFSEQINQNPFGNSEGIFELIQSGGGLLADFDFESFLNQSDAMDLDNPPLGTDTNPVSPPQLIPALDTMPQIVLPPHMQPITQQWLMNHPNLPFGILQGNGTGFFAFTTTVDDDSQEWPGPPQYGEYEKNLSFADFCALLSSKYRHDPVENARFKINQDHLDIVSFHRPPEVNRNDIDEYQPDYQGIPWRELDIERPRFRQLRNEKYSNYANMKPYPEPRRIRQDVPIRGQFFRFRKTCNNVDVRFSHFQLRNVISAVSKNDVYYTEDSAVIRIDPQTSKTDVIMDFRRPFSGDPIKITTLASDFGVIIAGGFYGEYAMKSLDSPLKSRPIEGLVTTDNNGITNHVHFFRSRTTGSPRAVFSSNDEKLRTLDCHLNKMVAEYKLPWAINCSATSPDGRLRVVVGDAKEVVIQGVDDGETIHMLPGHEDYGFACAWSDDGHTIATGNQDMMVRVYDARNFKQEVAVLDADIAGARSLRFSPIGSGPRVLAWAEPADMVSIIDAVTWESRQRIDFFGEIAGISFTPDGRELYIASSDKTVGGLMQFDRWKYGVSGFPDEQRGHLDYLGHPVSRKRMMRLRDINADYLGVI
ncbi:hypothetical protein ABW19_dt0207452 [Dactylella cylindrospora]|nr:hypothetical protein ABW19_dt0207452 [Dactylella cylindrospora]